MRKNAIALVAALSLSTTLVACGNGTGTATNDATLDETTTAESTGTPSSDEASDAKRPSEPLDETGDADDTPEAKDTADSQKNDKAVKKAESEGKTVLVGTVRMVDGPDIFEYEGVDPEMLGGKGSEEGNTYAILELDEEVTLSGMGADGSPRDGEKADHIGLGEDLPKYDFTEDTASQWKKYEGKRVCVAGDVWFPTDVSFPLSGRMSDAEVLYEE